MHNCNSDVNVWRGRRCVQCVAQIAQEVRGGQETRKVFESHPLASQDTPDGVHKLKCVKCKISKIEQIVKTCAKFEFIMGMISFKRKICLEKYCANNIFWVDFM